MHTRNVVIMKPYCDLHGQIKGFAHAIYVVLFINKGYGLVNHDSDL